MKTFNRMAAQGDFVIIRIDELPAKLRSLNPVNNQVVVAHSETGHNHVMLADRVQAFAPIDTVKDVDSGQDLYELFLKVNEATPIEHLRSYHTHESIMVEPGIYRIRRQREYIPTGWRKAAD